MHFCNLFVYFTGQMYLHGKIIYIYLLKARIVKPAEKAVAREWLCEQQPLVAIMWSPQQT
jgi:hypothetical protein